MSPPQESPLVSPDLFYTFITPCTFLFHFEIIVDPHTVEEIIQIVLGYFLLSFSHNISQNIIITSYKNTELKHNSVIM